MTNPATEFDAAPLDQAPFDHAPLDPAPARTDDQHYADLVRHRGRELTEAVAAIAEDDGALVVHAPGEEHSAGLVLALALLAAGLPHDEAVVAALPAEPHPASLLHALQTIGGLGGTEPYLLRHGLTVSQFHLLRDRFAGDDGQTATTD